MKPHIRASMAVAIAFLFLVGAFPIVLPNDTLNVRAAIPPTPDDPYPNSDWLIVWQRPNGSDPNGAGDPPSEENFTHEYDMTPQMTMDYYGTDQLQVMIPSGNYVPMFGHPLQYTWDEIANRSLFPDDCRLWVCFATTQQAIDISWHAKNDSRIIGAWIDDYPQYAMSPETLHTVHDALQVAGGPHLPLMFQIYDSDADGNPYWKETPYNWADKLPYFDGVWFSCLERTYDVNNYHMMSWEDAIRDLVTYVPGKAIYAHMYNHHYNYGTMEWDWAIEWLLVDAKLYHEGLIRGVSLLEAFWIWHNPRLANAIRTYFNYEFNNDWQTTVDFDTNAVTTELNGESTEDQVTDVVEKWDGNYTFLSRHVQTISFINHGGSHLTVRDLMTGEIEECNLTSTIHFIGLAGHRYQVYDWPHTFVQYSYPHPNLYINTTSVIADREIIIDGFLYIKADSSIDRSVIRFNHSRYDNSLMNHTVPKQGLEIVEGNITLDWDNTTFEPLNRAFTYTFDPDRSTTYTSRYWRLHNCTIAGNDGEPSFTGRVYMNDNLFTCMAWGRGDTSWFSGWQDFQASFVNQAYWYGNTFWTTQRWYTLGWRSSPVLELYESGHQARNTVVGGGEGFQVNLDYGGAGSVTLHNYQVYPESYPTYGDDAFADPWPANVHVGVLDAISHNRYTFPAGDTGWSGRTIKITSPFRLTVPSDSSTYSGVLKDAYGSTIGTYSDSSNIISASDIEEVRCVAGVVTYVHPFPWAFQFTNTLDSDYYWAVEQRGTLDVNRSALLDPFVVPLDDDQTVSIPYSQATSLHLVKKARYVYAYVPMVVHDGLTFDTGVEDGVYSNHAWDLTRHLYVPQQIPMAVAGDGDIALNVSYWNSTSDDVVVAWTMEGPDDQANTVTFGSLEANTSYDITIDGSVVHSATTDANGTVAFVLYHWDGGFNNFTLQYGYMNAVISMLTMVIVLGVFAVIASTFVVFRKGA